VLRSVLRPLHHLIHPRGLQHYHHLQAQIYHPTILIYILDLHPAPVSPCPLITFNFMLIFTGEVRSQSPKDRELLQCPRLRKESCVVLHWMLGSQYLSKFCFMLFVRSAVMLILKIFWPEEGSVSTCRHFSHLMKPKAMS
jgi:hypothetical protein